MSATIDDFARKILAREINRTEALADFERMSQEDRAALVCVLERELSIGEGDPSRPVFYEEIWQEEAVQENMPGPEGEKTVVFCDDALMRTIQAEENNGIFGRLFFVSEIDSCAERPHSSYMCRGDDVDQIGKILGGIHAGEDGPLSIIYVWSRGRKDTGIHFIFSLFEAIRKSGVPVFHVTLIGCYNPLDLDSCWDFSWIGFERSLGLVMPDLQVSLLYTDSCACLRAQLLDAHRGAGVIRYSSDRRFVLSFSRNSRDRNVRDGILKQKGGYLITGGCGALGLVFARHLAVEYHAKLLLIGRKSMSPEIQRVLDSLVNAGAVEAHYRSVDVSDQKSMEALSGDFPFALSGVIHAAGVASTKESGDNLAIHIDSVLRPKSYGTVFLDQALADQPLDFVCYFSSSAAVLGDIGTCDYAVANRFQMAYGHYRSQSGNHKGKTLVINWPLWTEGGMRMGDESQTSSYLKSSGQEALDTETGVRIWNDIIRADWLQALVMVGRPHRIEKLLQRIYHPKYRLPPKQGSQTGLPVEGKGWKPGYNGLSLIECVISDLRDIVSSSFKIPPGKINNTVNLADYGIDSIGFSGLAKQLSGHYQLNITPAIFFNYSTIKNLGNHLVDEHGLHFQVYYRQPADNQVIKETPDENSRVESASSYRKRIETRRRGMPFIASTAGRRGNTPSDPIAIVGISGRFPGAGNVDELWTLIESGRSGITDIPSSRWNWRDYFLAAGDSGNRISTNKGGFIDDVDRFDPAFFDVSRREAKYMDPAERILLMEAYRAIEDAGINPSSLKGKNVGVYVGMEENQYSMLIEPEGLTTFGSAMISSRLSYFLDLHGPAIAVNTACSSGLVALHQAVLSIRQGECEAALAAGIALTLSPMNYIAMSQAGMLSIDGYCYSLSKNANGIGLGEAVAVVMLKPLSVALRDRNNIYGTIKGSGINFDGRTNGVTAPNGRMESALIAGIYTNNDIDADNISHVVAHGTGTKLGDAVELNALNVAFKNLRGKGGNQKPRKTSCAVTSCKGNVGHTMAASGLVSVISLLKGMQHKKIPVSLYCEEENEYISWDRNAFYINKITRDWEVRDGSTRMGAVNAFGRSGTNAHVVIEEYPFHPGNGESQSAVSASNTDFMVPLSARTENELMQKTADLIQFIGNRGHTGGIAGAATNLPSICYTLQVGREEMNERVAFIGGTADQLLDKMRRYLDGNPDAEHTCRGNARDIGNDSLINRDNEVGVAIAEKMLSEGRFKKLMDLWVNGLYVDWDKLYQSHKPRLISLPTYPFAGERYWIDTDVVEGDSGNSAGSGEPSSTSDRHDGGSGESVNEIEKVLCELCQEILSVEKVHVTDNFYRIGGNSITLLQLISRSQESGLEVLVDDVINATSIKELAAVVSKREQVGKSDYAAWDTSKIYSLPNKQLLFSHCFTHHWNVAQMVNLEDVRIDKLEEAIKSTLINNEGLRHFFYKTEGIVREGLFPIEKMELLVKIDLSRIGSRAEISKEIERRADEFQRTMHLTDRLHRFVLFQCGQGEPSRFLCIFHHALIDAIGVVLFFRELYERYVSATTGRRVEYTKTTRISDLARALYVYSNSRDAESEIRYWTSLPCDKCGSFVDFSDGFERNLKGEFGGEILAHKRLNEFHNNLLLSGKFAKLGISTAEVIFTAIIRVLARRSGSSYVHYLLMSSGRNKIFPGIDVSKTIGWFSAEFPVVVQIDECLDTIAQIMSYREQVKAIPKSGLGFKALQYLSESEEVRSRISAICMPELKINYIPPEIYSRESSNPGDSAGAAGLPSMAEESPGSLRSDRQHVPDVPAFIEISFENGQCLMTWMCRDNVLKEITVHTILDEFAFEIGWVAEDILKLSNRAMLGHLNGNGADGIEPGAIQSPVTAASTPNTVKSGRSDLELEQILCGICSELFSLNSVKITDNFFALGGNSITLLQFVQKAQQAGIEVLAHEVIDAGNIKELADSVKDREKDYSDICIQREKKSIYSLPNRQFLFKNFYGGHWNVSQMQNIENANIDALQRALTETLTNNEGLRHFFFEENSVVREGVYGIEEMEPILEIDLSHLYSNERITKEIEVRVEEFQRSLNLTRRLHRFVLFYCGETKPARFLCIFNHSILDAIGMALFLDELYTRYLSYLSGKMVEIPVSGTISDLGYALYCYANSAEGRKEMDYWKSQPFEKCGSIVDFPDGFRNTLNSMHAEEVEVTRRVSVFHSKALRTCKMPLEGVSSGDVIFTAIVRVLSQESGSPYVKFIFLSNGRNKVFHGVDVSRTMGWFSIEHPVLIYVDHSLNLEQQVLSYRKQIHSIPKSGIGFKALQYLSEDDKTREFLEKLPVPDLKINYISPDILSYQVSDLVRQAIADGIISNAVEHRGKEITDEKFPVEIPGYLELSLVDGQYQTTWKCRDDIYKKSTAESISDLFVLEIERMVDELFGLSDARIHLSDDSGSVSSRKKQKVPARRRKPVSKRTSREKA